MAADDIIQIDVQIDNKDAQKELIRLSKEIQALEEQFSALGEGKLPLEENLEAIHTKLEESRESVANLKKEQAGMDQALQPGSSSGDYTAALAGKDEENRNLKEQEALVETLEKEWDAANQKLLDYDSQMTDTNQKMNAAKEQAGGLQKEMAAASTPTSSVSASASKMGAAMERVKKSAQGFTSRLQDTLTNKLVLPAATLGLQKMQEWMGKVLQSNTGFSAAMARLRGSLLTLAQPILNVLIPAFTTLVNVLTRLVSMAAQMVSSFFGTTVDQSAKAAENLYNETNAIESVSGTAEKASRSLADFDEINQLSGDSSSDSGGGVSTGSTAPDFTGMVKNSLNGIAELFTGIFLVALGAMLTFSGAHILLGIGMMVAGAMLIWDAITSDGGSLAAQLVETGLDTVFKAIGPLIAVIGIVLIVMGQILFGVGLLLLGISLWAIGDAAGEEGDFVENIKTKLLEAASVVGPLIAVIGIVLILLGQLVLGIGMVIAGIALFAVAEIGLNWELLKTDIVQALTNIAEALAPWIAIIGILLLFVPGMQAVGIGMIVAGIALFAVSKIAPNWNLIVEQIQNTLNRIKNTVASSLTWLDNLTGGFLSDIVNSIGQVLGGIIDFIVGVFTGDWSRAWNGIVGIFEGIWNGIVSIVKGVVNVIIGLVNGVIDGINWIIGGINSISFDLPDWLGGYHIGFNIGTISHIPYLAQGAVIPPNRKFLAVLGDQRNGNNIEAPEGLLRKLIREESGGSEVVLLLRAILDATKAGKKLYVDKKVLAQTAKDGINDMTIAAGKSVLLY